MVSGNVCTHFDTLIDQEPQKGGNFQKSNLFARMLLAGLQDFPNQR
jgi:hypothetical protein